ncbi:hypothetical protein [Flavobacterium anhuiense]|uniref:hypothetical protein n=1 Tax=Flavobacterium anhuiense TaxID=459526 RepID=UPI002026281D|nr:hypothetical protein [Flavobacterium anhuiense]URM37176.1 hypothetical protein LLY39_00865 [Flavobacterium anhuiense]
MSLYNINIEKIETEKIIKTVWIAKTTFFNEFGNKIDVEMKGESENNCYEKLLAFLTFSKEPSQIEELPNGNKTYHFKKLSNESIKPI